MRNLRTVTTLLAALTLAFVSAALGDEPLPDLFEPVASPVPDMVFKPHVVQAQSVTVDLDLLARLKPQQRISLNLAQMAWYLGVIERVDRRSEARFTVAGYLRDVPHGTFVIVVDHDVAVGLIQDPDSQLLFRLRHLADGVHAINQVVSRLYGRCGNEELSTDPPPEAATPPAPAEEGYFPDPPRGGLLAGDCTPLQPVFDMLIVYTDVARQAAGGTSAMNAECQLAIEVANGAYVNSEIDARMRLVYCGEVAYDEDGTLEDHLNRLAGTGDGFIDQVHTLRDAYRADVVSLFIEDDDGQGWCGLARCLPNTPERAFNVVRWDCAAGDFSYVHEVGHNQGCAHDRESTDPDVCNAYPYSYGWRFRGHYSFLRYRTVMAYEPGTRIQHFSNPNVEYDGTPTGVPVGDTDEAHNAQTINLRRSIVESHRLTRFDIWVDFAHTGAEQGTFDLPYDTVAEGVANIVNGVGASEPPNLWIKAGSTDETVSIDTPMAIRACGGLVTIGK